MKTKKRPDIIGLILYIVIFLVILFLLNTYVTGQFQVSGVSMEPALFDKDLLVLDKLSVGTGNIERGDIVIFRYLYDNDVHYVKRVIGLPGETVQIKDGLIYIDGEVLPQQYSGEVISDAGIAGKPMILSGEEYFVLGDNRNNSIDSRSADVGAVKKADIVGKVAFRLLPLERFGGVD